MSGRLPIILAPRRVFCLILGCGLLIMLVLAATLPLDPRAVDLSRIWEGLSHSHLCGRDGLGRDVLSRLLTGMEASLWIAILSLGVSLTVGVVFGSIAGWHGGKVDLAFVRGFDLLVGTRELVLAIAVAAVIGPGVNALVFVLGVGWSPVQFRFVRTLVLVQRGQTYVLAAMALGASPRQILLRHILPNIVGPLLARSLALIGGMIQAEAALSFLGIGVQDPAASLGTLVRDGLSGARIAPHLVVEATLAIFWVALFFILLSDELRDAIDPRSRGRRQFVAREPHSSHTA